MSYVKLDVKKLKASYNPFKEGLWGFFVVKRYEINKATKQGKLLYGDEHLERHHHIQRIAWFVVNGKRNKFPITVDFDEKQWPILDGNHRYTAAIVRNDPWILASVSGDEEVIEKFEWKD